MAKKKYRVVFKASDGNTYEGRVLANNPKAAKAAFRKKYKGRIPAGKGKANVR